VFETKENPGYAILGQTEDDYSPNKSAQQMSRKAHHCLFNNQKKNATNYNEKLNQRSVSENNPKISEVYTCEY
jgi:hypothetical protein